MSVEITGKERLKIPFPVIVEGKYDRLRLASVIDGKIITTDGFGIFKNTEKRALLRALAAKTPLIVLTDPDGAGSVIRSHLTGILPADKVIRLYVPRIDGKEKRKPVPSAEGVLGVEGMERDLLRKLFLPYADGNSPAENKGRQITAADLYGDGLTGTPDSAARRDAFGAKLGLPPGMNAKAFLSALSFIMTYDEYVAAVAELFSGDGRGTENIKEKESK